MSDNFHRNVTYTVNGKVYTSLDQVPEEYREVIRAMENAGTSARVTVNKTTRLNIDNCSTPGTSHREQFFHETVLPNIDKMDDAAIKAVIAEFSPEPKGVRAVLVRYKSLIWLNFQAAFWVAVLSASAWFMSLLTKIPTIDIWDTFTRRTIATPFFLAALPLVIWFLMIRESESSARVGAGMLGLASTMLIIVQIFNANLGVNWVRFFITLYLGISSFLYSATGRERIFNI